ncbi:MAG: hypothetical protein FJ029_07715 [Actinobacteria bacterium]|nr:hypothetical protein [Actinomycetota bacterium]
MQILIGVDDTDVSDSPGTGRLVRELARELEGAGARTHGVTRHQLWKHPSIPYTSQNSANCLGIETAWPPAEVADRAERFVRARYAKGADPAVAVGASGQVGDGLLGLARRAQSERLAVEDVAAAAGAAGLIAHSLAGEPIGLVGAVAAVALRASGNDGRFIELRGIRLEWEEPAVREILTRTAIAAVVDEAGSPVAPSERVAIGGWLRPSLRDGCATLVVARDATTGRWVNVENRQRAGHHQRDD